MPWKSVSKDKYLYLRGGAYYVRRRVPTSVRAEIGKEFLIDSLKTSDFKEASRLATMVNATHQRRIDEAMGRNAPGEANRRFDLLSVAEIEEIVAVWFAAGYRAAALAFGTSDLTEWDEETDAYEQPREARQRVLAQRLALLSITDHPSHSELVSGVIAHIIRANGLLCRYRVSGGISIKSKPYLVADLSSKKYLLFIDLVRRGLVELIRQEIAQLTSTPISVMDDEFRELIVSPTPHRRKSVTLGGLIDEFKADPRRASMRAKLDQDYSLVFRIMDEVIGLDRRVKLISRDDCRAVRTLLLRLPSNCTKIYPNHTFSEAADLAKKDGRPLMRPVTTNGHLHKMSALFKYAVDEDRMEKNPARALADTTRKHSKTDRLPFSPAQLRDIFSAPIYTGCANDGRRWAETGSLRPKGTKFWVPLIALFQGMRLNEICQLRPMDIACEDGVWFFHVQSTSEDNEDGVDGETRVKTRAGERKVPIHSVLLELGFLSFVQGLSGKRIFSDLSMDSRGYYSDGFQKWFGRFLVRSGAKSPKTSFHSFRHNWRSALREQAVPLERVRLIGGWEPVETEEKYGGDLSLPEMKKEIDKVSYLDLYLAHLY